MEVVYDMNVLDICACFLAFFAVLVAILALIYSVHINNNTSNIDNNTNSSNEHLFAIRTILEKYDKLLSQPDGTNLITKLI